MDKLYLIDFGISTKFKDDAGNHVEANPVKKFKGSLVFASKHIFNFTESSRRDDLISLAYFLIYYLD